MKEKRRYDCGALRSCFPIGNALTCSSRSWKSTLVIYESSSRDIATRTHQRFGLDAPMLAVQLNILDNLGNFVDQCREVQTQAPLHEGKDCGEAHLSCSLINPEVCFLEGSHARVGGERALKRGAGR
ncbi:hypothetical protein EVAR_35971_1 [Eumeta japonica]|uniref:Uncharacterized protein n=1 Tax=Eumeta variegata TaxID=151549 RepID=A0A4C1W5C2_EUMVA|nr:hypothetical protein EVAR_35971_1 [Eumeta japonica]